MSLDPELITQQLALLATHRRTLAHLLSQAAQYGGEVFAPPQTANGIGEARQQIRRIKAVLRKSGVLVEDDPNDKAPRRCKPTQPPLPGDVISGDKVAGDKVGGDKVLGDKNIIIQPPTMFQALHQLRAPTPDFVGREQEIDQLVQVLSKAATNGAAAAISGVRGMGGIGKTELAYVVANKLTDVFPDAQIVVELCGASSSPARPEQALQTVIGSFERGAKLPEDLGRLKGMYNSALAGKRVLIVVDDARDMAQVRPLLPPPGCALLATSRNRFSLPGMQTVDLEVLSPDDAEKLVLEICPRIGEYAGELAKLCGYLPLALRVSAGLLKENDSRDVDRYLEQLRQERLRHLADPDNVDDPQASVEASLQLSYSALNQSAQHVLCRMSVFPTSFDEKAAREIALVADDIYSVLAQIRRRSLQEWDASDHRLELWWKLGFLEGVAVQKQEDIDGSLEQDALTKQYKMDVNGFLELLRRSSLLEWNATAERYSLHDLVREFAARRIENADAVQLMHAYHYAETIVTHLKGDIEFLLTLLKREQVNIDSGYDFVLKHIVETDNPPIELGLFTPIA